MGEGEGGGDHSFHGQSVPYQTLVTYTPCVGFFSFLFLGLWNQISNKAKQRRKQSMGGSEICRTYPFATKEKQPNETKFVNKVVKFLSTMCEEIVDFACCVYVCTLWKHPFRIIDIVSLFREKTSVWDAIWKGTLFKTQLEFGDANLERHIV